MYHPVALTLAHVPIWLPAIMLTSTCPSLALFVSPLLKRGFSWGERTAYFLDRLSFEFQIAEVNVSIRPHLPSGRY